MKQMELAKYFSDNKKNYDSKYLVKILEEILGKSFNEIKEDINNKRVTVTSEQIESYLEQRFIEEDPELKKRIDSPKNKKSGNVGEWSKKDIEDYSQEFADELVASRYRFVPYTLEYFTRYTDIVRKKINILLNIVSGLANKKIEPIEELINDLDIKISTDGKVSKEDIIRLIIPIVANINMLEEKVEKANDLSTYLTFKESKDSLYRDGWSESEIYPMSSLQTQSDMNDWRDDNVKLSDNQKILLKKRQEKSRKIIADILTSLD